METLEIHVQLLLQRNQKKNGMPLLSVKIINQIYQVSPREFNNVEEELIVIRIHMEDH